VADLGLAGQDAQRNHHCPQQAIGQAFGPGVRTDDLLASRIVGQAGADQG